MIEWSTLRLFVAAALVLLLTPGPAVLYALGVTTALATPDP